ncbi:MAG: hypothetical protein L7S67_02740, partial [Flavobacteriales bacterium]|nr:hypothetical protein [Flavobacteriales bacterium]
MTLERESGAFKVLFAKKKARETFFISTNPGTQVSSEAFSSCEHILYDSNVPHIPAAYITIETGSIRKHVRHVSHITHIPAAQITIET